MIFLKQKEEVLINLKLDSEAIRLADAKHLRHLYAQNLFLISLKYHSQYDKYYPPNQECVHHELQLQQLFYVFSFQS